MEDIQNNQTSQPTAQITQPVAAAPGAPVLPVSSQDNQKKGSKTFLIIFLLILAVITVIMFFLTRNRDETAQVEQPTSTLPTEIPTPSASGSAEEQEVEQVNVEDTSPTDFPPVEKDVEGL